MCGHTWRTGMLAGRWAVEGVSVCGWARFLSGDSHVHIYDEWEVSDSNKWAYWQLEKQTLWCMQSGVMSGDRRQAGKGTHWRAPDEVSITIVGPSDDALLIHTQMTD